jgi:thioredoxin 1
LSESAVDPEILKIQQIRMVEMLERSKSRTKQEIFDKPIVLTDDNFFVEVSKHDLLVVDFWAPWCGPCRMVGPLFEQLASEYTGRVVFGKVNVDENMAVPNSFRVMGIPTIIVLKKGQLVETIVGACSKNHIESKFRPFLGNNLS